MLDTKKNVFFNKTFNQIMYFKVDKITWQLVYIILLHHCKLDNSYGNDTDPDAPTRTKLLDMLWLWSSQIRSLRFSVVLFRFGMQLMRMQIFL